MPAPLVAAAAGIIIRYIAKNGLKKAVERYGKKAVDNARKTKGTKGEKSVENFREAKGKAHSAARKSPKSSTTTTPKQVPAKRGNTTPAKAAAKKPPAVRSNASKEVGKAKAREGEYIPKGKPVGKATGGKKGNTYNQEPTMRANPKDRPNRGGVGSKGKGTGKKAAAAAVGGAAAAAMLASSRDNKKKKTNTTNGGGGGTKGYTVKSGDTLSQIAQRHGVRLSELRDANKNIKDLNKIGIGQKIKIPKASIKGTGKSVYEGMTKGEMSRLAKNKK